MLKRTNKKALAIALCMSTMVGLYAASPAWAEQSFDGVTVGSVIFDPTDDSAFAGQTVSGVFGDVAEFNAVNIKHDLTVGGVNVGGAIAAINSDYLKAADKTELQNQITENANDIAAIEADYLKAADKTELEGKITAEETARTTADTNLQNQIDTNKNSITNLNTAITALGAVNDAQDTKIDANTAAIGDRDFTPGAGASNYVADGSTITQAIGVLDNALKVEEEARIASDNTLQANIDAEAAAREAADNALGNSIASNEAAINVNKAAINNNADAIAANKASIESNEAAINVNKGKLRDITADDKGTYFNEGSKNQVFVYDGGIKVGLNSVYISGDDVSIGDPALADSIKLSELGNVEEIDDELKANAGGTAVGAINAEAAIRRDEVARIDNRIDRVEDRLDKVGAMSAAIANLRTMGYDPAAPSEFAMSLGHYRGETGMALGFFHYPHKDFMVSLSVSGAGDEYMGGVGATWKFGHRSPEKIAQIEKEKAAKAKVAKALAEKKAKEEAAVKAQAARHAKMVK